MGQSVKIAADMGAWYYLWNANKTDYDGIIDELGLEYVAQNTENRTNKDYLRGVNNVKPPKVKIAYGTANDGAVPGGETVQEVIGYCERMFSPVLYGDKKAGSEITELVGKKIKVARRGATVKDYVILSATVQR